jgi:hypothetical protein
MRNLTTLCSGLLVALTLACGGGSGPKAQPGVTPAAPAKGLTYVDPVSTGWRLVKDASSTSTRIVLNLVGPAGLKSRGAGFNLQAPAGVRFGKFVTTDRVTNGLPIKDMGVYFLLNSDPRDPWTGEPIPRDPLEPKLLAGGVKKGNLLTVAIFQKDRREGPKESGTPLCQIALEFDAAGNLSVGDPLPLTLTKAGHIAEDIGAFSVQPTREMEEKGHLVTMPVALGALSAQ